MSVKNGKVCCNCRHDIRTKDKDGDIKTTCDIDGRYIGYVKCMTGWCRHWAKDKEIENDREESDAEFMCKVMSKTVNKSTDDRNFIGGF